ncbi:hypothetical protein TNCV_3059701 [Trichonephila clavipes]|nr:hypothetical protein TNCV_3059701 [Trichonephila clavipes]
MPCSCRKRKVHLGTLNSRRAASPLVRLVKAPDPLPGCSPSKLGRIEINRTVACMVLKNMANDRRTSSPLP